MRLHRIRLQDVFSFQDARLTCDHHVTILVGPNDAGKTNILRALHHVMGRKPLDFPSEMRCDFGKGEPIIDLSFIAEARDRDALASLLNTQALSSSAKFPLDVSCQRGSLLVHAGPEPIERS